MQGLIINLFLVIERNLKYRILTYQELDVLIDDFSEFLYSEGLNQYEWKILLDQYSDEALKILGNYSDNIFEKVMQNVNFLEKRTAKALEVIKCNEDQFNKIRIEIPTYTGLNLLDVNSILKLRNNEILSFNISSLNFCYNQNREHEIFNLIEEGYKVVEGKTFEFLNLIRKTQLN